MRGDVKRAKSADSWRFRATIEDFDRNISRVAQRKNANVISRSSVSHNFFSNRYKLFSTMIEHNNILYYIRRSPEWMKSIFSGA